MQQWPNFFLIGAPKCGTTALAYYLSQHPQVLFSRPKEPHFFNDDFSYSIVESWKDYARSFSHGTGREMAVGEGSNGYLYSCRAVPNILNWVPEARFIVLLRDPVEASCSLYWYNIWEGMEDIKSFESAWHAQSARAEGRRLSRWNWKRENLQYGPMFTYSEQLDRLFNHAGRERVLVLLYDDLKEDTDAVYQQTLGFLGLEPIHLPSYERINASKKARWPVFQPILQRGLQWAGKTKRAMGWKRSLGLATRITTRHSKRPPLDPAFRAELAAYFREDVGRTGELIGRDLSGWARE
ncbi:hypothetical protein KBTX_01975 [wastewater metagenome]|uniref:Sulfotransferase domain-containing protein n=2 Tax=unclassified sequences TaxID=12908 RepID=A0A5B8RDX6_9ZZZZ|nr:sulfotransferase [Arhodomonas sp. KWT]QEA05652.1 hypothetical protein KBTEX_01975 [uncultured organism]